MESDTFWVERNDVYSVIQDDWLKRHTGFYKTPNGHTRSCGHHHHDEDVAEKCASSRYYKTLKESR